MILSALLTLGVAGLALGYNQSSHDAALGVTFDEGPDGLPILTLPYATYRAARYDAIADIYHFNNIRFAAPPVGDLRFAKPAPPELTPGIQDGKYGPACIQELPFTLFGSDQLGKTPASVLLSGVLGALSGGASEDCLFLDLQVPGKAVREPDQHRMPVVVWIYGGAYTLGSKSMFTGAFGDFPLLPLYDGTGPIKASGGEIIFASMNYRLGAYGWLAGKTMEKEGTPNLGLWDQRAAFQWVQDFIQLVGGDKSQVSAWGESAGAGSIYHHLVGFGGKQDPLFSKAVMLSPAYQILYDRHGALEDTFQTFAEAAGCPGGDMACLRAADEDTLKKANRAAIGAAPEGTSNMGPATDGTLIRQLANLEYITGNYWSDVDSLIISHTSNEAELFSNPKVVTNDQFVNFVKSIIPSYVPSEALEIILDQYPPANLTGSRFKLVRDRTKAFVRDSSFTCNTRYVTEAFFGKTFNAQYSATLGIHGTDILATFFDDAIPVNLLNKTMPFNILPLFSGVASAYQSYLTSHAIHGDPNKARADPHLPPTIEWPHPGTGEDEAFTNTLNVGDFGFSLVTDEQNVKAGESLCDFFLELCKAATNLNGYAPPGAFLQSSLGPKVSEEDASANFTAPAGGEGGVKSRSDL
ncbi:hypothetical protein FQN55_004898 [Onygenales sp. PD_40]|nr:hypothetical protein FQN55_004898 [Onygenales sp. PD_40]KAK2776685.1 hypothetical protein FQN52_003432 [Onygenales sp. PD_12]KAK2783146.1 hypothetical protein FQN53_009335 [Emmonsiellopsis sp. PD_33]KAK2801651.1 hypothetical protein FQN51_005195 [Onygenales sp. PD_10]